MTRPLALAAREPRNRAELEEYFALRYRLLREPLGFAPGAERDALEDTAFHVTARDEQQRLLGIGRVHFNDTEEAQIRYMATDPEHARCGVGRAVVARLEQIAQAHGRTRIVLNARLTAVGFYERVGYTSAGPGPTLDTPRGALEHRRMVKRLAADSERTATGPA